MKAAGRIFWMLVWLGGLAIAGTIVFVLTASRVGEHKSSTYGYAYFLFQEGWGGEIGIIPPEFALERTYTVRTYNKDAEQYEDSPKDRTLIPLFHARSALTQTWIMGKRIGVFSFSTRSKFIMKKPTLLSIPRNIQGSSR